MGCCSWEVDRSLHQDRLNRLWIGRYQSVVRMSGQITLNAICPTEGIREEIYRFGKPIVGFCTAQSQKPVPGIAKAFAAQARDSELVISSLQQVHR